MSEEKGHSEEKDGVLGKYIEHTDKDGNTIGYSEKKEGVLGDFVEHTDTEGKTTGYSEHKQDFFAQEYTEHTDKDGKTTGHSEQRQDIFGSSYVEHTDRENQPTGWSEAQSGVFGRYTEHHGHAHHASDSDDDAHYASQDNSRSSHSHGGGYTPSSGGAGGIAGAAAALIPLLAVVGVFWLLYKAFIFIFKICGGYKIAPMVSAEEQLRTRLARARAEYKQTQIRLARKRYTLAATMLMFVAVPFVLLFGHTIYQSIIVTIQRNNAAQVFPVDKNLSMDMVRERVFAYLKQNQIYGSYLPPPIPSYIELLEKETGVSWDGYRHLGDKSDYINEHLVKLEASGRLEQVSIEPISGDELRASYNFYPKLNGHDYKDARGHIITPYQETASEKIVVTKKFREGFWHPEKIDRILLKSPSKITGK